MYDVDAALRRGRRAPRLPDAPVGRAHADAGRRRSRAAPPCARGLVDGRALGRFRRTRPRLRLRRHRLRDRRDDLGWRGAARGLRRVRTGRPPPLRPATRRRCGDPQALAVALAHLHAAGIAWDPDLPPVGAPAPGELDTLRRQLSSGLLCTPTSSMGRLFDAVSSLARRPPHRVVRGRSGDRARGARRTRHRTGAGVRLRCRRPVHRRHMHRPGPGAARDRRRSPGAARRVRRSRPGSTPRWRTRSSPSPRSRVKRRLVERIGLTGGVFQNALLLRLTAPTPRRGRLRRADPPHRPAQRRRPCAGPGPRGRARRPNRGRAGRGRPVNEDGVSGGGVNQLRGSDLRDAISRAISPRPHSRSPAPSRREPRCGASRPGPPRTHATSRSSSCTR